MYDREERLRIFLFFYFKNKFRFCSIQLNHPFYDNPVLSPQEHWVFLFKYFTYCKKCFNKSKQSNFYLSFGSYSYRIIYARSECILLYRRRSHLLLEDKRSDINPLTDI